MVDTSGSIRDEDLTRIYSEILGACEQFQDKLKGKLGFFDVKVYDPVPFETAEDILAYVPVGGGGTDFSVIFSYIETVYREPNLSCIIIFTDGCGPFPEESATMGYPILWIIYNSFVKPPFGRVIYLEDDDADQDELGR